jgi:hypothetical protein
MLAELESEGGRDGRLTSAAADVEQVVAELTATPLERVDGGTYRVVFGSRGWVVKRSRSFRNSVAIAVAAHLAEKLRRVTDRRLRALGWGTPGLALDPMSREGRSRAMLRLAVVGIIRAGLTVVPAPLWKATPTAREVRDARLSSALSAELAARLDGTGLTPPRIDVQATRVRARGRRSFSVTTAFRRVNHTILADLRAHAKHRRDAEIDALLDGFLECQVELWRRGVFSMDILPFVNYGVLDGRVVLLDSGSLTDDPLTIRRFLAARGAKLAYTEAVLAVLLTPERARRFRERMAGLFTPIVVRRYGPVPEDPRWDVDLAGSGKPGDLA